MKVGLTLGKFAPLHRGHQLVIEKSLAEMDHTIVLIYDMPELDVPPVQTRTRWLRQLYPTVEVIEAWDGPTEVSLDPKITAKHDAYLAKKLAGKNVTHFYSSEEYGKHVSLALNAIDCRVDEGRKLVPISATEIRSVPFKHRQFLSPIVYRDLIKKVVFLGAPSTGKTTLASTLAKEMNTEWMPEYGREYWEQHQVARRLNLHQLVEIADGHRSREDELILNANRYFFVDTDASTTLQFSYYYHETADERLVELARDCRDRYDVVFLCDTDIPYDDTWDRSGDVARNVMQRRILSDLIASKRPFHLLSGTLQDRVLQARAILEK